MDVSNHLFCTSSNEVSDICKPLLKHLNINFFAYIKCFPNGRHLRLSNHATWTEHYYKNQYYNASVGPILKQAKNSTVLWSGLNRHPVFADAAENFNIDHGIILVRHFGKETELYSFGTSSSNQSIINIYLEYIDLLERFGFFFKEAANLLIKKASLSNNLIYLPAQDNDPEGKIKIQENIKSFIEETPVKKHIYGLLDSLELKFSLREIEILSLMILGLTAREIGFILCISKRTVESHIEHIRAKLNVANNRQIFEKIRSLGFINYLISFGKSHLLKKRR